MNIELKDLFKEENAHKAFMTCLVVICIFGTLTIIAWLVKTIIAIILV